MLRRGVAEAALLAENSGHPAFIFPLYDGNLEDSDANRSFLNQYQQDVAFQLTKQFSLVFTRAIDVADYYRRHFATTPRTVFISQTDSKEISYVLAWQNVWAGRHEMLTRERIPWLTRISSVHQLRDAYFNAKDPLADEYMVVEGQRRSLRFERESPNPIWWFDYSIEQQSKMVGERGSTSQCLKTPDVDVVQVSETRTDQVGNPPRLPKWERTTAGFAMHLKMLTNAEIPNYAIVVWDLPESFASRPDRARITTNAKLSKSPAIRRENIISCSNST